MEELNKLSYICLMAFLAINTCKTTQQPMGISKYRLAYEKQFEKACAEYDKYYAENYIDIIN